VCEGSFFPTSSPAFVVVFITVGSHSDCSEMESQCCFDLHFLLAKDIEHSYIYWPFVLVLLRSDQLICPFINWIISTFLSSLYILDIDPLPNEKLPNTFSCCVDCLW
jgi:hypothetical protein